jgi:hypothetical protein
MRDRNHYHLQELQFNVTTSVLTRTVSLSSSVIFIMCNTCKPRAEVKSKTLNSLRQTRPVYLHALRAFLMCKQFDLDCDFANNFYVCIARQGLSHI